MGLALVILTKHGNALFFDLFSVIIALSVHVLYCSLFSLDIAHSLSPLFIALSLASLFLAVRLFVCLCFALWDLVPACLTSLTMKQMLILIILLAEISL